MMDKKSGCTANVQPFIDCPNISILSDELNAVNA